MERGLHEQVEQLCRQVLAPLIVADGGEMYLGSVTSELVSIHLAGACAGCPGSSFTSEKVISPIIHSVIPRASVIVTTGWNVPEGWTKI